MKKTTKLTLAGSGLCLLIALAQPIRAQALTQNITLSPSSADLTLSTDTINKGTLEVLNTGDSDFTFTNYVTPFRVSGEDYKQDFTPLSGAADVTSWFKVNNKHTTLQPGKLAEIPYTITVPKGTPPGGYYAVLFAETKAPPAISGVVVTDRVGEIFYITVSGALTNKGNIASWQSKFLQKPPLQTTLRLQNEGTTHFLATVQLKVKDVFGHTKYTFTTKKEVLPRTIRRLAVPWQKTPSFGLFKVGGTVDFLDQKQTLPTRYVLIMSQTVRLILLGVIVAVLLITTILIFRKKHKRNGTSYQI